MQAVVPLREGQYLAVRACAHDAPLWKWTFVVAPATLLNLGDLSSFARRELYEQ
jgi:hypothetical protein